MVLFASLPSLSFMIPLLSFRKDVYSAGIIYHGAAIMAADHASTKQIILTLGGARSGKSDHAEAAALQLTQADKALIYLATGQAFDEEMKTRIGRHQTRRDARFTTVEAPLNIADVLADYGAGDVVMIDSIGVWITNHMMAEHDLPVVMAETIAAMEAASCTIVLVSDEVGMGIVPEGKMSRDFRDHIGMMNQSVASIANMVVFVVAGLPMIIKSDKNNPSSS